MGKVNRWWQLSKLRILPLDEACLLQDNRHTGRSMSGAIVCCGSEVRIIVMNKEAITLVRQQLVTHIAKVQ
jgi:hypothetical protein